MAAWCPFEVEVEVIAGMLNAEFAVHPIYDGIELQRFDDASHGSGLLVFLSRRADRRVDYYVQPGLRVDPTGYRIGGGTGAWTETAFPRATFEVSDRGAVADVAFTDVDGRTVEVRVDDRGPRPRRRATLLAPVGDGVVDPAALLLVWLHGFDLVHRGGAHAPEFRIDGELAATGRLPGAVLHRRHLVKYAAPLTAARICPAADGPVRRLDPAFCEQAGPAGDGGLTAVRAGDAAASARLTFDPPFPDVTTLGEGDTATGHWHVEIDGADITGGSWSARRAGDVCRLRLDVTQRWHPAPGAPWLVAAVTRLVPVFRRWPTTYRWNAEVTLDAEPRLTSRWTRTGRTDAAAYRRLTTSATSEGLGRRG